MLTYTAENRQKAAIDSITAITLTGTEKQKKKVIVVF